jgi:hypothetical protein
VARLAESNCCADPEKTVFISAAATVFCTIHVLVYSSAIFVAVQKTTLNNESEKQVCAIKNSAIRNAIPHFANLKRDCVRALSS